MTTTKITTDLLREREACPEGIARFERAFPAGLDYDPTSHECAARILGSECAGDVGWAVGEGIMEPMRLTAGDGGSAQAGDYGTAQAGDYGLAQAGDSGTASAGRYGTLCIRHYDDTRYRLAVAYVGEHAPGLPEGEVIQSGVAYRVNDSGEWLRA